MLNKIKDLVPGLLFSALIAILAIFLNNFIPGDIIGATVMALLLGMAFNPILDKNKGLNSGVSFSSTIIFRIGIILMGVNLNFAELVDVGRYSLFLMAFTMGTAFIMANLVGKIFKINWKLVNLLSVSTAICGGSAVAAVGPVINARNEDITYAISATFIFDIITVIMFPLNRSSYRYVRYRLWTLDRSSC